MSASLVDTGPHVVVVGAGVAGLVAARTVLAELPEARVTVLEGTDRVGGKLRRESVAGHLVDVGAESMLARRPEGVGLVESLGAGGELVAPQTTSASIWSRGSLRPLPTGTVFGVPTSAESARGILSEAEVKRLRMERPWPGGPLTHDVSVGEYLGTRLGPAVIDRLVEPMLGGVYAGQASRLSLRATMPPVWTRAVAGDGLLGSGVRGGSQRDGGTPRGGNRADGRGAAGPVFAGLRGGVGRLPELLVQDLRGSGVTVRTGAVVRGLERSAGGWRLVVGSAAAPEVVEADAVLVCVPSAPAGRLLAPSAPVVGRLLGEVETASVAVVTLAVQRSGLGELPGSGFLVPPVEGHRIKASTFSFAKWAWTGELSDEVVHLRASFGRAGEEADLQRDDPELVATAVEEIAEALGRPLPTLVDSHVQRWGGGLPQYLVGHVEHVARIRDGLSGLPGVEVAGAVYDGVGIPAVIGSATRAASAVVEHLRSMATVAPPS